MRGVILSLTLFAGLGAAGPAGASDPERGAEVFRTCIACHTLAPGDHRTGPSLAGIVGRAAGTVPGFTRYSKALDAADVVWDHAALDAWLEDPAGFIPGNRMTFPGIPDGDARADLIAYLEAAGAAPADPPRPARGAMMGAGELADLRSDVGANNRVEAIRYCGDTYTVEVESGAAHPFWEFNLRFKTDSSARGPEPGRPVLVPAGMMGDRAFIIFADPAEISAAIDRRC